jgi:hypothetical protein
MVGGLVYLKMAEIKRGIPTFAKVYFGHLSPQRGKSLTGLIEIYDALIRPATNMHHQFSKWSNNIGIYINRLFYRKQSKLYADKIDKEFKH